MSRPIQEANGPFISFSHEAERRYASPQVAQTAQRVEFSLRTASALNTRVQISPWATASHLYATRIEDNKADQPGFYSVGELKDLLPRKFTEDQQAVLGFLHMEHGLVSVLPDDQAIPGCDAVESASKLDPRLHGVYVRKDPQGPYLLASVIASPEEQESAQLTDRFSGYRFR